MSEERENVEGKSDDQRVSIGRIPLKQVRVSKKPTQKNPMNLLVPYLDLFSRLSDEELSRLAGVSEEIVAELRGQVVTIDNALHAYVDLLPRLSDREMVRLTGATPKTVRFWRLCQPRVPVPSRELEVSREEDGIVARAASAKATTAPFPAANAEVAAPGEVSAADSQPVAPTPVARSESRPPPPPPAGPKKREVQQAASRLMTFSGDPFPGFDESAAGFEGVPSPDEVDVALSDLEEETTS